ncbi:RluA family pseudouridine synthase [Paenibacillus turpanensis]|uniref:RluA family pseudouridine synthase n=1 Tax=Paenibacillus turpanensis TaxID=2689078 RepID=UPI00140B5F5F|nr:RluA family pseudouridine synthase [Paenibacillus turpanensis]
MNDKSSKNRNPKSRTPARSNGKASNHIKTRVPSRKPSLGQDSTVKQQAKANTTLQWEVTSASELLAFVLEHANRFGRNTLKSMLARGQIEVDGRSVTKHNHPLHPGQSVTIHTGKKAEPMVWVGVRILHEDDDLLVIHKDAGLLSIASATEKEITAYRQLTEYVRRTDPANRIFVVHRLDRDTSGVMVFAKNEQTKEKLQTNWQEAVTERTYIALVEGKVKKPEGVITSWLKESKTLLMYSSSIPGDGQHAVTRFKTLQASSEFSLLEVELETGRKNQIRVHMQDIGHPVVGDKKYGSRKRPIGRLGLHAKVLAFQHPTTGESMRFESDVPKEFFRPFKTQ